MTGNQSSPPKFVQVTIAGSAPHAVATVLLNRPEARNAFEPVMIRELTDVFKSFAGRSDLGAIVLRGAGKSFCAGADLEYMKSMANFSFSENQEDAGELFDMFSVIRACPQPIVGLVHGHVMGGALGLLALCDLAAAVEGTQFCFSEVKLGLAPAVISPFVLEKMNVAHARRYFLTGEVFGVDEAFSSGLINFKGDLSAAETFISQMLKNLGRNGPESVRATKQLLRRAGETREWSEKKTFTTEIIAARRGSDEGQEGLRSFFEKRAPGWIVKETKGISS